MKSHVGLGWHYALFILKSGFFKHLPAAFCLLNVCKLFVMKIKVIAIYMDKFVKNYKKLSWIVIFCYKLSFSLDTYENITVFFVIFGALWKMLLLQVWAAFPLSETPPNYCGRTCSRASLALLPSSVSTLPLTLLAWQVKSVSSTLLRSTARETSPGSPAASSMPFTRHTRLCVKLESLRKTKIPNAAVPSLVAVSVVCSIAMTLL